MTSSEIRLKTASLCSLKVRECREGLNNSYAHFQACGTLCKAGIASSLHCVVVLGGTRSCVSLKELALKRVAKFNVSCVFRSRFSLPRMLVGSFRRTLFRRDIPLRAGCSDTACADDCALLALHAFPGGVMRPPRNMCAEHSVSPFPRFFGAGRLV